MPSYLKNNIYYHYSAYNSFVKSFFIYFLLDNSSTGCIIGIEPPGRPLYPLRYLKADSVRKIGMHNNRYKTYLKGAEAVVDTLFLIF